jgi:IPT/TIG domain-containing protein
MSSKPLLLLVAFIALPSITEAQEYWPVIESRTPTSGPVGLLVKIEGQHFGDSETNSTITFNGTKAQPIKWSDSQILVRVPEGATTGLLEVTVNGLRDAHSYHLIFTVISEATFIQKIQSGDPEAVVAAWKDGNPRFVAYLLQRIQAGDLKAIEVAGKSGNKLFIPCLRSVRKHRWHQTFNNTNPAWAARLALARLDDTEELQGFWCRAITDDPKRGLWTPVEELEPVGGWFSIHALEKILTTEHLIRWHKPTKEEINSDALSPPFEFEMRVIETLSKVVSNPPVKYSTGLEEFQAQTHIQDQIQIWRDWIAAHKDELSKLQPTGEGVDFSPSACKNGKPRKRH